MSALTRIISQWLRGDRIRVSPREGKLLRMQAGGCIRIRGESFVVEARTVNDGATAQLSYHCCGVTDEVELLATLGHDGSVQLTMNRGDRVQTVAIADVDCFG